MFATASRLAGLLAGVGDPGASRTVYAIVVGLALIGVVLIALGIWLVRKTRVDPELLGPLERMDDRSWRKLDPVGRRRVLDEVRPDGAEPVRRMPEVPDVDDDFERPETVVPSFDDLERIAAELEIAGSGEETATGRDGASTGGSDAAADPDDAETVRFAPDEHAAEPAAAEPEAAGADVNGVDTAALAGDDAAALADDDR